MERIRNQSELIETQEFQIIELEETNEEVKRSAKLSYCECETVILFFAASALRRRHSVGGGGGTRRWPKKSAAARCGPQSSLMSPTCFNGTNYILHFRQAHPA